MARGASLGVRSDGRMNVLFLLADDLRSQSMVYGKPTFTPSLARLARRGVVFDRAYAQVVLHAACRMSFGEGVCVCVGGWHWIDRCDDDTHALSTLTVAMLGLFLDTLWPMSR